MPWHRLKDELAWDDVGGRLLANLARGIYNHEAVVREYVQNACDAYNMLATPPADQSILIRPEAQSLTIQDNGIGMAEEEIRALKKIAVSTKAELDEMTGFRGIGIWAGFQACKRLVIVTTKQGVKRRYRLVIDFEDILAHVDENINIKQLVDPRYHIEWEDAPKDDHYTRVTLEEVHPEFASLLDVTELTRIASQKLPCPLDPEFEYVEEVTRILGTLPYYQEFPIKVGSPDGALVEAYRRFPQTPLYPPEKHTLKTPDGIELGHAWFCRTQDTSRQMRTDGVAMRGFRMRVRNFAVGPMNIYNEEDGHHYGIAQNVRLRSLNRLAWFCGEIHITNKDVLPNTPREDLERDAMARMVIAEIRGFYKTRVDDAGAYSEFNGYKAALEKAQELVQKLGSKPPASDSVLEKDRKDLLRKLTAARNETKGKSGEPEKEILKNLLRGRDFKAGAAEAIEQLSKLAPRNTMGNSRSDATKKDASKTKTNGSANGGSSGGTDSDGADAKAANAEEMFSEILEILERHLGAEHDQLADIAEEVKELLKRWGVPHAT
jgi:hypothetical protein